MQQLKLNLSSTMAIWEGKQYRLEKSENFDAYMEALGKLPYSNLIWT